MALFNEVLFFLSLAFGIWLFATGFRPLAKIFAGHLPVQGLRDALAA